MEYDPFAGFTGLGEGYDDDDPDMEAMLDEEAELRAHQDQAGDVDAVRKTLFQPEGFNPEVDAELARDIPSFEDVPEQVPAAIQPPSKRAKTGSQHEMPDQPAASDDPEEKPYEPILVFKRAPPEGQFVPVTSSKSGQRFYLIIQSESLCRARIDRHMAAKRPLYQGILETPIAKMRDELERMEVQKLVAESQIALEKDNGVDEAPPRELWVDKYRPRSFLDLLSSERTNREVLQWLKAWDKTVFGHNTSGPKELKTNVERKVLSNSTLLGQRVQKVKAVEKEDTRPEHKVLLLAGPPGLGKTTLAHILAKTAGYYPLEINASDDRSEEVLSKKIQDATENNSVVLGKPNCLIVDEIDGALGGQEGKGPINVLVQFVTRGSKKKDTDEKKTKKRGGRLNRPIICICNDQYVPALRPLRAVARVFVFEPPSKSKLMERLQWICQQEQMPFETRALSALADLAENDIRCCLNTLQLVYSQKIPVTMAILKKVGVGQKDRDKDQFELWDALFNNKPPKPSAAGQLKPDYDLAQLAGLDLGPTKASLRPSVAPKHDRWTELYSMLQAMGDSDKVLDGIHHNYLNIQFTDPTFDRVANSGEWMSFADTMIARAFVAQEMYLYGYVSYAAIGVSLECAVARRPHLEIPRAGYVVRQRMEKHRSILETFTAGNGGGLRDLSTRNAALDFISLLLDVLAPAVRNMNFQLLSARERQELDNLVDTLVNTKLTYVPNQEHFGIGTAITQYQLDPPIDSLVVYTQDLEIADFLKEGKPERFARDRAKLLQETGRREVPNQLKQLLAKEVEMAVVRAMASRHEEAPNASRAASSTIFAPKAPTSRGSSHSHFDNTIASSSSAAPCSSSSSMPASMSSSSTTTSSSPMKNNIHERNAALMRNANEKKSVLTKAKVQKSTFLNAHRNLAVEKSLGTRTAQKMHFSFNEGFTNAVRRTVFIKDFT